VGLLKGPASAEQRVATSAVFPVDLRRTPVGTRTTSSGSVAPPGIGRVLMPFSSEPKSHALKLRAHGWGRVPDYSTEVRACLTAILRGFMYL
jgi:hypothetical protein